MAEELSPTSPPSVEDTSPPLSSIEPSTQPEGLVDNILATSSIPTIPMRVPVSDAWKSHISSIPPLPSMSGDGGYPGVKLNQMTPQGLISGAGLANGDLNQEPLNAAESPLTSLSSPTQSHLHIHTTLARPTKLTTVDLLPFPQKPSNMNEHDVTMSKPIKKRPIQPANYPTGSRGKTNGFASLPNHPSQPPKAHEFNPNLNIDTETQEEVELLVKKLLEAQEEGTLPPSLQEILQGIVESLRQQTDMDIASLGPKRDTISTNEKSITDSPVIILENDELNNTPNLAKSNRPRKYQKRRRSINDNPPLLTPANSFHTNHITHPPNVTQISQNLAVGNQPSSDSNVLLQNPLIMAYMQNMTNFSVHHFPVNINQQMAPNFAEKEVEMPNSTIAPLNPIDNAQREIQHRLQCLPQLGPAPFPQPPTSHHLSIPQPNHLHLPNKRRRFEDSCLPEEVSEENWLRTLENTIVNLSSDPNADQQLLYQVKLSYIQGLKMKEERIQRRRQLEEARIRAIHELEFLQFQQQQSEGYKKVGKNVNGMNGDRQMAHQIFGGPINNCVFLQ